MLYSVYGKVHGSLEYCQSAIHWAHTTGADKSRRHDGWDGEPVRNETGDEDLGCTMLGKIIV